MKLEEAIEIKETELEGSVEHTEEELCEAERLIIEAGKRIQAGRPPSPSSAYFVLPGETEK